MRSILEWRDEKQVKFDLTDHSLIKIHLEDIGNIKRKHNRKIWILREYCKTDKDSLEITFQGIKLRI